MVRTKAGSVSNKAIGAKAPQKVTITAILSGNAPKTKHTGGNPYHPRETPDWQKPITFFMKQDGESSKDESIEIEDLPGLPGIRGDVISPKASGSKRKSKAKKSKEPGEADDEKKVKTKQSRKKSEAVDGEEKGKRNRKKEASDMDVERKSKKKKKEESSHSEKEDDLENEDANNPVEDKENVENFQSDQRDLEVNEASPGKKKSDSNGENDAKDEGNSKVQKSEENGIENENGDEDRDVQENGDTDEEMEERNNNDVMDQDEFEAIEDFEEDEPPENA